MLNRIRRAASLTRERHFPKGRTAAPYRLPGHWPHPPPPCPLTYPPSSWARLRLARSTVAP